jgi:hypothetical protein
VVLGGNLVTAFFPQIGESAVTIPWLQIGLIVLGAYALLAADDDCAGMAGVAHLPGGRAAVRMMARMTFVAASIAATNVIPQQVLTVEK